MNDCLRPLVYHAYVPSPFVFFRLKQPAALDCFDERKCLSRFGVGLLASLRYVSLYPHVVYHACVPLPFVSFRLKQPAALDSFNEKKWLSRFGRGCLLV